jgi:hypothetical protein
MMGRTYRVTRRPDTLGAHAVEIIGDGTLHNSDAAWSTALSDERSSADTSSTHAVKAERLRPCRTQCGARSRQQSSA